MKWFRFYSEVLHDSKVQTLPPEMFKHWANLLCLANEGQPRGTLPSIKQVAFVLHVKEDKAKAVLEFLIAEELFDRDENGVLTPHNWTKRQHNSDDVNSRVRDHRKRKPPPKSTSDVTLHETVHVDIGNVTVTPRVRADSETDSESETNTPQPPGGQRASNSVPAQDCEPFESGVTHELTANEDETTAEPPPLVQNDPIEIERLVAKAKSVFPGAGVATLARATLREYKALWVSEALDIARERKARAWSFVRAILNTFTANGESDSEKQARLRKPTTPSHVVPFRAEYDPRKPVMRCKNAMPDYGTTREMA